VVDEYGSEECHAIVALLDLKKSSLSFKVAEALGTVLDFLLYPHSSECVNCCMSLKLFLSNFMKFNKIFLRTQPCQLVAGRNRRFGNCLCPHHQGCDVTGQPDKSAVVEHNIEAGHDIDFNITILDKVTGSMDRLVKEAIEVCLHSNNFNRDGGFNLSRTWQPVTNMLRQSGEPISKQDQSKQALDSTH
jgi:hypothetical protein